MTKILEPQPSQPAEDTTLKRLPSPPADRQLGSHLSLAMTGRANRDRLERAWSPEVASLVGRNQV